MGSHIPNGGDALAARMSARYKADIDWSEWDDMPSDLDQEFPPELYGPSPRRPDSTTGQATTPAVSAVLPVPAANATATVTVAETTKAAGTVIDVTRPNITTTGHAVTQYGDSSTLVAVPSIVKGGSESTITIVPKELGDVVVDSRAVRGGNGTMIVTKVKRKHNDIAGAVWGKDGALTDTEVKREHNDVAGAVWGEGGKMTETKETGEIVNLTGPSESAATWNKEASDDAVLEDVMHSVKITNGPKIDYDNAEDAMTGVQISSALTADDATADTAETTKAESRTRRKRARTSSPSLPRRSSARIACALSAREALIGAQTENQTTPDGTAVPEVNTGTSSSTRRNRRNTSSATRLRNYSAPTGSATSRPARNSGISSSVPSVVEATPPSTRRNQSTIIRGTVVDSAGSPMSWKDWNVASQPDFGYTGLTSITRFGEQGTGQLVVHGHGHTPVINRTWNLGGQLACPALGASVYAQQLPVVSQNFAPALTNGFGNLPGQQTPYVYTPAVNRSSNFSWSGPNAANLRGAVGFVPSYTAQQNVNIQAPQSFSQNGMPTSMNGLSNAPGQMPFAHTPGTTFSSSLCGPNPMGAFGRATTGNAPPRSNNLASATVKQVSNGQAVNHRRFDSPTIPWGNPPPSPFADTWARVIGLLPTQVSTHISSHPRRLLARANSHFPSTSPRARLVAPPSFLSSSSAATATSGTKGGISASADTAGFASQRNAPMYHPPPRHNQYYQQQHRVGAMAAPGTTVHNQARNGPSVDISLIDPELFKPLIIS
ncbi:hypothetical protein AJ80_02244 [Polytolypa hystricis UAMH7299]|uniref:Uncharacterized protein n=1 Tax=Polytolypa hystricis (strain UAMH7299) TaxID=1447883 RepID=A0A2B7YRX7_POLH7|nr:hypothetical protein AJ80_02244 [Polytolypa hystricis UAMH7299]